MGNRGEISGLTCRIKNGVDGLDKVIEGSFPKGSLILSAEEPGSGKTVFSTQFLTKGAELGEPGVHACFAGSHEALIENLSRHFAIGLVKLEAEGRETQNPRLYDYERRECFRSPRCNLPGNGRSLQFY